jgi:hypothetical protein
MRLSFLPGLTRSSPQITAERGFRLILVFKQYDSQVNGVARFTPHAAFDLPDIATDAPLRQSIEIRCLVT